MAPRRCLTASLLVLLGAVGALVYAVVELRHRNAELEGQAQAQAQRLEVTAHYLTQMTQNKQTLLEAKVAAAESEAATAQSTLAAAAIRLAPPDAQVATAFEGFNATLKTCRECKSGGRVDGGVDATGGCPQYCSRGGFCGTSPAYVKQGTDCRRLPHCPQCPAGGAPMSSADGMAAIQSATVANRLVPIQNADLRTGITLVIHGDLSRLPGMLRTSKSWAGDVSIAVLVHSADELAQVEQALRSPQGGFRWCAYLLRPRYDVVQVL